jgi:polygalacturonase
MSQAAACAHRGVPQDGKTDDTAAIQAAFDHCAESGGGTI